MRALVQVCSIGAPYARTSAEPASRVLVRPTHEGIAAPVLRRVLGAIVGGWLMWMNISASVYAHSWTTLGSSAAQVPAGKSGDHAGAEARASAKRHFGNIFAPTQSLVRGIMLGARKQVTYVRAQLGQSVGQRLRHPLLFGARPLPCCVVCVSFASLPSADHSPPPAPREGCPAEGAWALAVIGTAPV